MDSRCDRQADSIRAGVRPQLELLCTCSFETGEPQHIGYIGAGHRFILSVCPGGEVEGPHLRGVTMPDSTIVQLVRTDGVIEFQARLLLKMSDGPLIVLCGQGRIWMPEEVAKALAEGAPYDPTAVYAESYVRFEAAEDGPYAWLTRGLFVGKSVRELNSRTITVWRIL